MPRQKEISAEQILDAAYQIVILSGFKTLTARALAKQLNCSTQPIYLEFKNMGAIKQCLYERFTLKLLHYIQKETNSQQILLNFCLGYLKFAKAERQMYRVMVTDQEIDQSELANLIQLVFDDKLKNQTFYQTLTSQQKRELFERIWITLAGIATLTNAKLLNFETLALKDMLGSIITDCHS